MSTRARLAAALTTAALALALPATASASTTIGTTVAPAGAVAQPCDKPYVMIPAQVPTELTYTVPAAGGEIHEWQLRTQGATPGTPVGLVVARPAGNDYTVVGVDAQTVPSSPAAVTTFAVASPIAVQAGDVVALHAAPGVDCIFDRGEQATGTVRYVENAPVPAVGATITAPPTSKSGIVLNVAASVRAVQDVTVEARAAAATAGGLAALQATVTNHGPTREPIELTDVVPAGLAIQSAVAGDGRCSVQGQTVSCAISGLAPGESAPVVINVVPAAPGTYRNSVSVRPGEDARDPAPADNAAQADLTVAAAAAATGGGATTAPASTSRCVVPALRGTPLRVAKTVLRELGCTVGKVKRVRSRKVRKGTVIRTAPAASTQPAGTRVNLRVSRGAGRRR